MLKRIMIVTAGIMLSSTVAFALTLEEQQSVQKAADTYLSGLPAGEYSILAEKLLERINSGKKDFVIVDGRCQQRCRISYAASA